MDRGSESECRKLLREVLELLHSGKSVRGCQAYMRACHLVGLEPKPGPGKKYESNAERQRAYRERKNSKGASDG